MMNFKSVLVAVSLLCASGLTMAQGTAPVGSIEAGRNKASMCMGCHAIPGYRTAFPEVYTVPMIAGQNEAYIRAALNAYARRERTHPTMVAISAHLSEQDIADLAAYYASIGR